MSYRQPSTSVGSIDWITFALYLALASIGCGMIYAVSYNADDPHGIFDFGHRSGKQVVFLIVSLVVLLATLFIDSKFFRTFAYPIYAVGIVLLFAVLVTGAVTKGATSWFEVGPIKFQPSEFAKFATCLAIAAYISTHERWLKSIKEQATLFGILLLPMALILLQGDAGSALVFTSFFILLFREGLNPALYVLGFTFAVIAVLALLYDPLYLIAGLLVAGAAVLAYSRADRPYIYLGLVVLCVLMYFYFEAYTYVALGVLAVLLLILFLGNSKYAQRGVANLVMVGVILTSAFSFTVDYAFNEVLQSHQRDRINVWIQPEKVDPSGPRYNVDQSMLAIGSGGLYGKGFLEGTHTKGGFVPEQSTDFIFCTVGEEQGFVGSMAVIVLYLLLMSRIVVLAERQRSRFTRAYAYGVAGILCVHFIINIGMTIGLMPVIGIPLPFISYGGSSLLSFTILVAVLLRLDGDRYLNLR